MDKVLDAVLPILPGWLILPSAAIVLLLFAWPTLRDMLNEALPSYRRYSREKQRLELLKLCYEIAAIRTEHQINDLPPIESEELTALVDRKQLAKSTQPDPPNDRTKYDVQLSGFQRATYGALGSLVVPIIVLFNTDLSPLLTNINVYVIAGYATRFLIMILLGGFTTWLSASMTTPIDAFMRGIVAPAAVTVLISSSPNLNAPKNTSSLSTLIIEAANPHLNCEIA